MPECKITFECVGKHKYMRGKHIYIRKHVMFEYNMKMYIYISYVIIYDCLEIWVYIRAIMYV